MNKYVKIVLFSIFLILILFFFLRKDRIELIAKDTIQDDINNEIYGRFEIKRVSNGNLLLKNISRNKLKNNIISIHLNDITELIESNDSIVKIPNSNKCIVYKQDSTILRFNYIDYSDEMKLVIRKQLNNDIEEWNENEIGLFKIK